MKALLLLCLIALISCNIVDVAMCLYADSTIVELVKVAIEAVKTANFSPILSFLVSNITKVFPAFSTCFSKLNN